MSFRPRLAVLGTAACLGMTVAGSALADPVTDADSTLNQAGVTVNVPTVPEVTVPHTGVAPVDGVVDSVNDTIKGATDTVNDTTGRLGGGGSTQPPAASTPPSTPSQPTGQPVDTG